MQDIRGTKTERNLREAFAGETQAAVKYEYYAKKATKQGLPTVAEIFKETSINEKQHAKIWYKFLHESVIPDTDKNLLDAAEGEMYEWTEMYERMEREAKEEGFGQIAYLFRAVKEIEKRHEERYRKILSEINDKTIFAKDEKVSWICTKCGHIHTGEEAPSQCPVCAHEKGYFKVYTEE